MEVIATGMATTSIYSSTSWNVTSVLLLALAVALVASAVSLMARQHWSVEPEAEPEIEVV